VIAAAVAGPNDAPRNNTVHNDNNRTGMDKIMAEIV
jgi:hypothetical protein